MKKQFVLDAMRPPRWAVILGLILHLCRADSDLYIKIANIPQPYNCTLFLDNLEVREKNWLF